MHTTNHIATYTQLITLMNISIRADFISFVNS